VTTRNLSRRLELRKWVRRAAIAIAIVVFLWLTVSAAVAYRLTHRHRPRYEERIPRITWGQLEGHRIRTSDGEELGAWFSEGDDESPSVLLLHGSKGSRHSNLMRAEIFASLGWSTLMISHRAHGDSSGDFHDDGFGERHDVVAAVAFLEASRPGRPIVVMGTSLGSAAAVFAATELGHRVQGYNLESPYKDLKTAVWNRTDTYLPPVLSHAAYAGLRAVGPLFLPHLDQISPLKAIGGIPDDVPVLILAGAADRLARPYEAQALFGQVSSHGKLVFFPGADHQNLPESTPKLFKRTLLEFCREIESAARVRSKHG
jgi:alpha-beta hydrolase superfamily lysophospholipase